MYEAHTVLVCEGLETGHARDIHGQVRGFTLCYVRAHPPRPTGHSHCAKRATSERTEGGEAPLPRHRPDGQLLSARLQAALSRGAHCAGGVGLCMCVDIAECKSLCATRAYIARVCKNPESVSRGRVGGAPRMATALSGAELAAAYERELQGTGPVERCVRGTRCRRDARSVLISLSLAGGFTSCAASYACTECRSPLRCVRRPPRCAF